MWWDGGRGLWCRSAGRGAGSGAVELGNQYVGANARWLTMAVVVDLYKSRLMME